VDLAVAGGGIEGVFGGFEAFGLHGDQALFDVMGGAAAALIVEIKGVERPDVGGESGERGEGPGSGGALLGGGFGEQGVHVGDIDGDLMESPVDLGELGAEVGLDAVDWGVLAGERDDVGGVGFALGFGEDEGFAGVAVFGGVFWEERSRPVSVVGPVLSWEFWRFASICLSVAIVWVLYGLSVSDKGGKSSAGELRKLGLSGFCC